MKDTDMEEKNRMDINKLKETIRSEIERGQYSLMNDELFGYVFGREESRDITAEFLSAALEKDFGHPITGISFVPPMELPVHGDLDQVSRFMARCELGDEEHIFAELQLVNYMESRDGQHPLLQPSQKESLVFRLSFSQPRNRRPAG